MSKNPNLQKTYDNAKRDIVSDIGIELYNNAHDYINNWLDAANEQNKTQINNMHLKNIVNIVNLKRKGEIE